MLKEIKKTVFTIAALLAGTGGILTAAPTENFGVQSYNAAFNNAYSKLNRQGGFQNDNRNDVTSWRFVEDWKGILGDKEQHARWFQTGYIAGVLNRDVILKKMPDVVGYLMIGVPNANGGTWYVFDNQGRIGDEWGGATMYGGDVWPGNTPYVANAALMPFYLNKNNSSFIWNGSGNQIIRTPDFYFGSGWPGFTTQDYGYGPFLVMNRGEVYFSQFKYSTNAKFYDDQGLLDFYNWGQIEKSMDKEGFRERRYAHEKFICNVLGGMFYTWQAVGKGIDQMIYDRRVELISARYFQRGTGYIPGNGEVPTSQSKIKDSDVNFGSGQFVFHAEKGATGASKIPETRDYSGSATFGFIPRFTGFFEPRGSDFNINRRPVIGQTLPAGTVVMYYASNGYFSFPDGAFGVAAPTLTLGLQ